jgi:hypothetical protein
MLMLLVLAFVQCFDRRSARRSLSDNDLGHDVSFTPLTSWVMRWSRVLPVYPTAIFTPPSTAISRFHSLTFITTNKEARINMEGVSPVSEFLAETR